MNDPAKLAGANAGQFGRLGRLVRKELNEILRDRRTIITLVLMPLLLYPLLYIVFQQFILAARPNNQVPLYRLGCPTSEQAQHVRRLLRWKKAPGGFEPTRTDSRHPPGQPGPKLELYAPVNDQEKPGYVEKNLRTGGIDLGIRVRPADVPAGDDRDLALDLELIYVEGSPIGEAARNWVENQCALANIQILKTRLRQLESSQRPEPVETMRKPLKASSRPQGNFLAALVPLILILMTITGAVYPAIDLTAGERERGTLEILVAAPVPRLGLLFAKYVTVLTVAVLTALVNLVMMTVTLTVTGLAAKLLGGSGLSPLVMFQVFGLLLLFATFFSAVLLTLTSFARSFKEAQAYLVPLMLASLAPGVMGMIPGLELAGLLSVVPLVNIVLLTRDLLDPARSVDPAAAIAVVLSTLLYATAALALAARIFGAEAVLYSEQGGWSDLLRRPREPRAVATVAGALCCVALMFPADFLLQVLLGRSMDLTPGARLVLQVAITALLFGGFPLVAAFVGRVRLRTGFLLRKAPWPAYPAAVILGGSLWPFALALLLALRRAGSMRLGPEHQKIIEAMVAQWRELSPVWIILAAAVVPAVFEELFFRGFLFSALRARSGPLTTILVSAVLFGLFHSFFTFEQVVTSTLLGVVLGGVCWRTGSVWPGIIIHACHNSLVFLALYYQKEIGELGWFDVETVGLPAAWLIGGAGGVLLGTALLWLGPQASPHTAGPEEMPISV